MNCKECKEYNDHVVEVIQRANEKTWICFHCWSITKDYRLTSNV
jgi:hypothetical protein